MYGMLSVHVYAAMCTSTKCYYLDGAACSTPLFAEGIHTILHTHTCLLPPQGLFVCVNQYLNLLLFAHHDRTGMLRTGWGYERTSLVGYPGY